MNIIRELTGIKLGVIGLGLLMVTLMFTGICWGVEATPAPEKPKVRVAPEEERPPEVKPSEEPGFFPGIVPTQRALTMEIGPVSGILAPYGNPAALDTLKKGSAIKAGPFRVAPYLSTDMGYRSNLYQTQTNKKATSVFAFNPGIYTELPLAQKHKISVGYLGNSLIYPAANDNSHYDNNVNVDASFNFPGGLSLRAGNTLRIATEEPTAESTNQRFYHRWTPYFLANYAFADRWKLQVIYQYNKLYFAPSANSNQNNYNDNTGGVALYYKILPKTAVLGQFIVAQRTYPYQSLSNNYCYTPMVGLTWDATAKLTGIAKVGYTIKDYEKDTPGRKQNNATPAFSGQLTYKFDERTNLALTAQRAIQEDSDVAFNSPYENTAFYLTLDHLWAFWDLSSYANISYTYNNYINETQNPGNGLKYRQDSIISTGVGISRPFTRYLRLRLDYSYSNKASNFSGYSYNEHRVVFGIQATM
jgi:hypothetical protein